METMAERLKEVRSRAGYSSAREAAEAMGVKVPTYAQHENGIRNFPRDAATRYARFFRTTPEWLLYGRGKPTADTRLPSLRELESMIRDAISEVVTLNTRLADLPHIVAPSLHEQLERYQADREGRGSPDQATIPGRAAQPLLTTRPS